jgi:hypothetical protein
MGFRRLVERTPSNYQRQLALTDPFLPFGIQQPERPVFKKADILNSCVIAKKATLRRGLWYGQ